MELPKIKVADFEGPFDLLLHLIKKNKMDIYNVEIYKVTNQYLEYLNTRKVMDLEITSEFIVVAATLIEIKSKNLLPKVKVEEEENEEDIEIKLMERLIEYKRFKAVSEFFNDKYVSSGEVFSKKPEVIEEIKPEKVDNDDIFKNITLLDLYNIYNKILENYREKQNKVNVVQKKIYVDKYKVEDKMEELLKKFNSVEVIEFNNLMKTFQIYLLRGGEILSNIDVKQYEFNELSRKSDIKSAIESMLFVSGEPLPLREISNNLELKEKNVVEILQEMTTEYEDKSRGIRLISLDEAYQLVTKSENSEFVQKLLKKNKKHSLSQASIESLAIIAYKQPITRIDIDEIRGVKSESAITRLVERGLIKDVGRLEVPGRPILYGTTDEFLRQFGLKTIKELPSLDLYGDEGVQSSMDLLNKAIEDIDLEENKILKQASKNEEEAAIDEEK